jgi:hypothetical protein
VHSRTLLAAVLCGLLALFLRRQVREHADRSVTYEDIYYLPPTWSLPVLSLGHDAALADLLWIRSLVYIGDEYEHRGALAYVFDYTDSVLALDPDFEAVYHWVASAGLYQPSEIGRDEILRTIEVLTRGVERMPGSGQLQWDLGATYAFESAPYALDDAERDEWRLRGIEHLMIATRLGAAPPWMTLSNAAMLMRVGANERAVEHLEEMYATIDDPAAQEEIAQRIATIRGETYSAAFIDEAEALEAARIRAFPYAHPHLYFLMGPRPPVDVDSSLRDGFATHAFDDEIELDVE